MLASSILLETYHERPCAQRHSRGKPNSSIPMAKRKSKGGKAKVSVSAAPEVETVAIILMNAVVAAIDDFESDQSFLVGMGSVGEDEIPEGGMEGAEGLKASLTQYLGGLSAISWEPQADDLGILTDLISEFDDQGLLKIKGAEKGPDVYVGWASDFAWLDGTSAELEKFEAICRRVLAGSPVASSHEELEEVASVVSVDVKLDSDGKWVVSSGDHTKLADSVLDAAKVILTDRIFWCVLRSSEPLSALPPMVQNATLAVQGPSDPTIFHEDGGAFRYERGYRIYL